MNEESRPARWLPDDSRAVDLTARRGQRAWAREVRQLADEELMHVVRGMAAVDRAVDGYRRGAA
jgi:hypothetical protein